MDIQHALPRQDWPSLCTRQLVAARKGTPGSVILDVSGTLSASLPLGLTDTFQFNGAVTLIFPSTSSGAPAGPENFLTYNVGNTLNLVWDPAASCPATTSFVLNVSGAFNGTFPLPTRGLSAAVPPGTYNFTLSAVNPCGASAPTAAQTVVVP